MFKSDGFIQKMNSMTVGIREGKNIQYSDFANSLIPVPPINQQQRIADYLDRKPRALSGGQRQRVALARSVCSHAPLCLMDEPLSNLDAKLRASMRVEIRRLQQQLGLTVIYVTHDQVEAMTMGDRIAVLSAGRIQQLGTPLELYNHPANEFVATFIGTPQMNMAVAEVAPEGLVLNGGLTVPLSEADRAKLPMGQRWKIGFRPEQVYPATATSVHDTEVTVVTISR